MFLSLISNWGTSEKLKSNRNKNTFVCVAVKIYGWQSWLSWNNTSTLYIEFWFFLWDTFLISIGQCIWFNELQKQNRHPTQLDSESLHESFAENGMAVPMPPQVLFLVAFRMHLRPHYRRGNHFGNQLNKSKPKYFPLSFFHAMNLLESD